MLNALRPPNDLHPVWWYAPSRPTAGINFIRFWNDCHILHRLYTFVVTLPIYRIDSSWPSNLEAKLADPQKLPSTSKANVGAPTLGPLDRWISRFQSGFHQEWWIMVNFTGNFWWDDMGYMIIYDVIPSKDVKDLQKLWSNGGDWKNIFGTVEWGLFHILGDGLRLKLDVFRTFRSVRCLCAGRLARGRSFPRWLASMYHWYHRYYCVAMRIMTKQSETVIREKRSFDCEGQACSWGWFNGNMRRNRDFDPEL